MKYIKAQFILEPTTESNIWFNPTTKFLELKPKPESTNLLLNRHIHIITDDTILDKDFFIIELFSQKNRTHPIFQYNQLIDPNPNELQEYGYKKVIATTDPKFHPQLPKISNLFLEKLTSRELHKNTIIIHAQPDSTKPFILNNTITPILPEENQTFNLIQQFTKDHPLQRGIQILDFDIINWITKQ